MLQLTKHLGQLASESALSLTLPFDQRCKSRLRATLSNGIEAAVLLPRGTVLRGGDVIANDVAQVKIIAADEAVLFITATSAHDLLKGAYHLGNRHTPVEVGANYLAITADPVLADMLERLGLNVTPAMRPFEPEFGAYGAGHKHGHDDTFAEDYALAQERFAHHHGDGHVHSH